MITTSGYWAVTAKIKKASISIAVFKFLNQILAYFLLHANKKFDFFGYFFVLKDTSRIFLTNPQKTLVFIHSIRYTIKDVFPLY